MSQISNTHSFASFDSKTSKALGDQRLSKVVYKTPRNGGEKKDSQCVSIPRITHDMLDTATLQAMKPYLVALLENTQDKIIRERCEAGAAMVQDSEISIASCIAWLDEDAKGGRLTKEFIGDWFDTSIADLLTVAIADKLGVSDTPTDTEAKKLSQMITMYRDKFSSLAGGKTSFVPKVAENLQKVLELAAPEDDILADKFMARLEKMKQVEMQDDLMLNL